MGHFGVYFVVFGGNEKASQCIDHKFVDLFDSILKVKRSSQIVNVAIVQNYSLKNGPCHQSQLFSALNEPFYKHFSHLNVVRVDSHGWIHHAI